MTEFVYLDNNATTTIDERVLAAMLPALRHTGNASSAHDAGDWSRRAVESARSRVAELLAASSQEVVFTSGSTESNNLAIKGIGGEGPGDRAEIVTCTTEHAAVLQPVERLRRRGYEVRLINVGTDGVIDLDELAEAVSERTLLVTVMAANNETGVVAPLGKIADIAHDHGALVHTDATQVMAWGGLDTRAIPVDLLSLSAHKFHGPQGVGALYVRRGVQKRVDPLADGGGHERGLRSGTLNTAGIVGLGAAAELARCEGQAASEATRRRRDLLLKLLTTEFGPLDMQVNGHATERVPGTLNVSFLGMDADAILASTPSVAMSTGSACSTGVPGPSHVLTAMGFTPDRTEGSIRLSLSRQTTDREITAGAEALVAGIREVQRRTHMVGAR